MAYSISPGVSVSEVDLTTVVPAVLTTAGAFAGAFRWGPANKRVLITNETQMVSTFFSPDTNTAVSFFTAASFLAYGNNLTIVRPIGPNHKNSSANANASIAIANEDTFEYSYLNTTTNANIAGPFIARYPGALGNSLTVSIVDANTYSNTWNVNGVGLATRIPVAPNTSIQAAGAGALYDQVHVVVVDTGGLFTGAKNTILEVFPFLSKGADVDDSLGNSNYYKNYIFRNSKYIYAMDPPNYANTSTTWGLNATNINFANLTSVQTITLGGGADSNILDANTQTAYSYFTNADETNINLVISGDASVATQQYIIDNIANQRQDCLAFVSPPSSSVVNQPGNESANITTWLNQLARSTSYAVADSGWKYMFDKFNNAYRWIPLNGDIAGLCAYTDAVRDPWYSPAGYNRGNLRNVVKLAWNPNKTYRDVLYGQGVNPVVTFPGQGTVLFGDKTLLSQPSAFDRINVRRLFLTLEKSIAAASKFSLFEFNDVTTRNQFIALVTPFLRQVQARRGIYNFRVVCDGTNNPQQVVDSNQFVGDIYIQPARSVNFIQLNFVAVRTGVDFQTIVQNA